VRNLNAHITIVKLKVINAFPGLVKRLMII
jgi:hypothetical protein